MNLRRGWILLTAAVGLFSAQCGEIGGLSADVDLKAVPDDPIVIDTDLVRYPGTDAEETIKGPWFLMGFSITNGSAEELWVVTTRLHYSVTTSNGVVLTTENEIDVSVSCEGEEGVTRAYQVQLAPGDTFTALDPDPNGDGTPDYTTDAGAILTCDPAAYLTTTQERWYFQDLPPNANVSYQIRAELVGFFVDDDGNPIENLNAKEAYINTR